MKIGTNLLVTASAMRAFTLTEISSMKLVSIEQWAPVAVTATPSSTSSQVSKFVPRTRWCCMFLQTIFFFFVICFCIAYHICIIKPLREGCHKYTFIGWLEWRCHGHTLHNRELRELLLNGERVVRNESGRSKCVAPMHCISPKITIPFFHASWRSRPGPELVSRPNHPTAPVCICAMRASNFIFFLSSLFKSI